ncbi:MAG: MFS transporter [Propionibacteriaceae bacterium]|nr:MFS transporter [Micropruina sp.]
MTGYLPTESGYKRASWALFVAGLATFTMIYCAQPLLPIFASEFQVTPANAAMAVSATTICLGLAGLVYGPLSDAIGRRQVMIASLGASAGLTIASAFVDDWTHLMILRGLIGLAVAGLPATTTSYLREEIHPDHASAAISLFIGGNAIGGMTGRFVTGALTSWFGWRWAIAGVGLIGVASFVMAVVLLPKARVHVRQPLQVRTLTENAVRMATDPGLLRLYATGFCTMGAFVALFNAMSFRLAAPPYSLDIAVAGAIYLTYAFGSVASTTAGRLWTRFGPRTIVPVAMGIQLVGVLVTGGEPLWLVVVGSTLVVIGFFAAHGTLAGWVTARAELLGPGTGQAGALYLFAYYLGSSVAGTAAGAAWSTGGWTSVIVLTAIMVAVGAGLAASMRRVPSLKQPPVDPMEQAA